MSEAKTGWTPGPWKLHRGFSDWGMPCQHDVFVGEEGKEDQIAGIPSLTPYCMGASAKDRNIAGMRWADACLISMAPELYKQLEYALLILENHPGVSVDTQGIKFAMAKARGEVTP